MRIRTSSLWLAVGMPTAACSAEALTFPVSSRLHLKTIRFDRRLGVAIGHPQTCVYPDVCLGIAHVSGKVPLSGQGVW